MSYPESRPERNIDISSHINNIFKEAELSAYSVVKDSLATASDGQNIKARCKCLIPKFPHLSKIPSTLRIFSITTHFTAHIAII